MKKTISLLLSAALLLGLVSCGRETVYWDPTYNISIPTQGTSPTETQPQQLPMVSVSMPVITQDYTADDGTVIYKHTSQNISLIIPDPEVADKVILDFLNRTDMQSSVDFVHSTASDTYKDGVMSHYLPYWTQITYAPVRIDSSVLSLYGSYVQYSGGAHPIESAKTASYDLITGEALSLTDILTEKADADTLSKLVSNALALYAKQNSVTLYTGYEATVKELFSKPLIEITNWCLNARGLCFAFSPYEIGPYSAGCILANIPYEDLTGILQDRYFPNERDSGFSTLNAEIFDTNKLEEYTQFAEIVISKDAPAFLLSTDGILYDIIIAIGSWDDGKEEFKVQNFVFNSFSLTPGDGIMVQAEPEQICIRYTTDKGIKIVYPQIIDGVVTLK